MAIETGETGSLFMHSCNFENIDATLKMSLQL